MRKLKLQMQVTVDGFVAGPEGQLDWMTFDMDPEIVALIHRLADTSDTILMGRKMTPGFVEYWERAVTQRDSPEQPLAEKMVRLPKVVFSRTVEHVDGKNVRVEKRDLTEAVRQLKSQPGKDLIVYGGATFVSSLIEQGLIDELSFFVNPVAIGGGMRIFTRRTPLERVGSRAYPCGIVVTTYVPKAASRPR